MTEKQLNELGFEKSGYNRVWHTSTETDLVVGNIKKLKANELINRLHASAYETGKTWGSSQKMYEIRNALGLTGV